jgi:hypothetical protein
VPHVSGVDAYELLIRRLCGEDVAVPPVLRRAAALEFFDFTPGRVRSIEGLEEARQERLAEELSLAFAPGDVIVRPTNDRNRNAYALVLGETRDDVDARCARLETLIRIDYE